jgi:hypothetical protein
MTLPIFQTSSKDLSLLQTNWSTQINPVLAQPMAQGLFVKNVTLNTGSNVLNHRLGRRLQGWIITRIRALATIYDTQDTNQQPDLTLVLVSSATVQVDLYVF